MWFTFQESRKWDSSGTYPGARKKSVKANSEQEAREGLPRPSSPARTWILVDPKEEHI